MTSSPGIEDLNLDHNLIGDGGARELLQGLMLRKEAGFPIMKLWVTVYISQETFQNIVEHSSTAKKKKGGKAKKKVSIKRPPVRYTEMVVSSKEGRVRSHSIDTVTICLVSVIKGCSIGKGLFIPQGRREGVTIGKELIYLCLPTLFPLVFRKNKSCF